MFADSFTFWQCYGAGVPSQGYRIYSFEYPGLGLHPRVHARHLGRANINFADGHAESSGPENLAVYAPGGYYDEEGMIRNY